MKTKKIKNGTKFVVCGHKELSKKGWKLWDGVYTHKKFGRGEVITYDMIESCQGQIFTVKEESELFPNWFWVDQNECLWPVDQFIITVPYLHNCVEGMTPIDGWVICKICGTNLKEIG